MHGASRRAMHLRTSPRANATGNAAHALRPSRREAEDGARRGAAGPIPASTTQRRSNAMNRDPARSLHRPEPPVPDVEPDPDVPVPDDVPPGVPQPYHDPEGEPPVHPPPEREPPTREPPIHVPPTGVPPVAFIRFTEGLR
jgi:hypothetical protein